MVSFSCEVCNDTIVKKKLDQHTQRCYGAYFTCIDCSTTFLGTDYRKHTSCISEAEKYEKALYKGPKTQKDNKKEIKNKQEVKKEEKKEEKKKEEKKEEKKKEEKKEEKKEKKEKKKEVKSLPLEKYLKSETNMYKIFKKASKESSTDIKELLKSYEICKNATGEIVLKHKI